MATTSLRIYLHDIEGLVGAGQTEEAIAHCRYILQTFPKSIAVYRLLGKAYLESQRYSDAADVLQRVLSAVPDDFISHVGMSIIREDEGNLDASIWHMERAFEAQPYNTAIQDELRRLYGRRDGMEPPKMRLTRGALARMYMKGNLHQQAIGELRAALAEDPQRPDLQALLARVYYMAGQRVEAVETCSTLLKKLPYCMDANILLGAILPETERAQDAQNYRQRAIALDPYFTQAASNALTADNVPASAVNLEKLAYSPGKAAAGEEGQPAWATSLGVAFNEEKEGEALPDWLAATKEATTKQEDETSAGTVSPFSEGEASSTFPWEPSTSEAAPPEAEPASPESIPDWMKEAGWSPSTGTAQEGPASFNVEEEAAAPVEGTLAPADIPDWLREAAPPGVLDQAPTSEEKKSAVEELPWLQETPPGSSDTVITWLNETKGEALKPAEETPSAMPTDLIHQLESEDSEQAESGGVEGISQAEIPDWLKESTPPVQPEAPAEAPASAEVPDWLQATPQAAATPEEELPDWLKTAKTETPAAPAVLPDWLQAQHPTEEHPAAEAEQGTTRAEEVPEWLKSEEISPEIPTPPSAPIEAAPIEQEPVEEAPKGTAVEPAGPVETAAPAEEYPAWLKEVESEIPEDAVETPQLKGVTEWLDTVNTGDLSTGPIGITDWLNKVEPGQEPPPAPGAIAADEIPDWLKGIVEAKQAETAGAEEQPTTAPAEEIPEGLTAAEPGTPPTEVAPALPAEEMPDWLKEIEAGAPAPAAETPAATQITEVQAIIPEPTPSEPTPAFDSSLPAGLDLSDQDAAMAWLEGLAAKQGVPESELTTKPEERAEILPDLTSKVIETPAAPTEELPDWMREVTAEEKGPDVQQPEEPTPAAEAAPVAPVEEVPDWLKAGEAELPGEAAPVEEAVPAVYAEEVPDWLKEAKAEAPVEVAPTMEAVSVEEAVPAVPMEEVPDWLKEVEAEIPEETTPAAQAIPTEVTPPVEGGLPAGLDISDQDAALAWLEGLAAKQGVPEDELFTKPEERAEIAPALEQEAPEPAPALPAEEVPDWLKEVEAEVPEEATPTAQAFPTEVIPPTEGELPGGLDISDQDAALAWLEGLAAKQGAPEEELITKPEERAEIAPTLEQQALEPAPAILAEEVPEWLKAGEAELHAEAAPAVEAAPVPPIEEVPDWLKSVEAEIPEEAAPTEQVIPTEVTSPAEGGLPAGLDLSDQDAALAWLEGLAAKQGVPEEELFTKPEVRAEIPPALEQEAPEPTPAVPAEEVPEWLKELEAEAPQETAPVVEVTPAAPVEEVPDWLKEVEAETPSEGAPVEEAAPVTPVEEVPAWLKEVEAEVPAEPGPTAVLVEPEDAKKEIELEAPATPSFGPPPVEIPSQAAEWIKETELPQWQDKTEEITPEGKLPSGSELPGWIAEAAQESEPAWVPPQTPETEEKAPARVLTNLNSATVGELERLPGIGFVLAQSIINHRDARGPFTRMEDLLDVPGIGPGTIDAFKDWITIQPVEKELALEMGTAPLDPDHLILRKAQRSLQEGDIPAAITQYEQLLKKLVLLNEIILDLQDALYRYPVDISIWQALGDAYMRNNQLQDALDAYTKAEELLR
jgi:competence ComEA-like helix-hairpin-helix protein